MYSKSLSNTLISNSVTFNAHFASCLTSSAILAVLQHREEDAAIIDQEGTKEKRRTAHLSRCSHNNNYTQHHDPSPQKHAAKDGGCTCTASMVHGGGCTTTFLVLAASYSRPNHLLFRCIVKGETISCFLLFQNNLL